MKNLKYTWFLLVLLALTACGRDVAPDTTQVRNAAAPTITSDKEDYAPGELVTLTGSNWQPGESVHINVDDDQTKTWVRNINVTADETGNITDKFNLPDWFVATYQVVATGQVSGVAKTSFTDGNVTYSKSRVPDSGHQSVQAGQSWNFSMTLNKQGGGSDPTVNTPFVVINPTGDNKTPATCGKAETAIPASWLSVVSPSVPKVINQNTDVTFRVSPAVSASGTYTGRVNLTTTDGGSQTFDLCLNVTAANNPAPTLDSVSPTSATQGNTVDVVLTGTNFGNFSSVSFGNNITANSTTVNSATKLTANITIGGAAATGTRNVSVTNAAPGGGTATLTNGFTVNAACTAPSITTQPTSVTATVGGAATFSVTAGGTGTLSYQWLKGDTNIQGATSASYDLTSVTTTDAGNYSVKATNSCGSVTSNAATLTVDKAKATISLGDLNHTYDGSAKSAMATTSPEKLDGLSISYGQDGNAVSKPTNAGSYAVVATLDNASYSAEDATGTLIIGKADQTISWDAPAAITYGTPLGDTQLNATRTTGDGGLSYDPSANTVLGAGTQRLTVTAAETDNFKATFLEVSLKVNKAEQTISWSNPDPITYGTPLGDTQLNASTSGDSSLTYNLKAGTLLTVGSHTLKVDAAATDNYNAASKEVSITVNKADQTITFGDLPGKTFGDPAFTVSAAGGASGNAVSFTVAGNCTASGSTISITGAGSCTITASQSGNDNYNAAEDVSKSFTIAKADQSISFTGAPSTAVFGNRFTVNATGGASGQAVVLAASGACTISGNEVTMTSGTGTCSLTASQAGNDNYNAAPQATQSTTAQKATATVTLGDLNYVFDGTAKSASATTSPAGLNVSLSYSPSSPLKVGSYSVNATITDQNYQGSASGMLTISAWTLRGFYAPVDMGGVVNTVKAGSTVPLKFEIFAESELTNTSAIFSFKTATVQCSTLSSTSDEIEVTTTGGTSLRYDSTAGQFIQNWQTPKTVGVCYRATLTTQDSSTITAYFKTR